MPRIEERDYSWTEQANILFIDRFDDDYGDYGDDDDDDDDDDRKPENFHPLYSHKVGICQ